MWLPETAVCLDTLEALAEHDIAFTILAPHQVVPLEAPADGDLDIDMRRPCLIELPSGRSIAVFAYHDALSKAVAFERLLDSGLQFADRLLGALAPDDESPQLAHIATDGETYGHHHRFGEMALAHTLEAIEARDDVALTNYGEFLERHPPEQAARLVEHTSWSCAHGIERWREDCGCHSGAHPTWNQAWRAPLRTALDVLRDDAARCFENEAAGLLANPWAARDGSIDLLLAPDDQARTEFLRRHAGRDLDHTETARALKMLELQRHAMLMFTSCGWFFDDVSGIETQQILQYAGRVVELCRQIGGVDFGAGLERRLAEASSNLPEQGTGREVYRRAVKAGRETQTTIGSRCALHALAGEDAAGRHELYGHDVVVRIDERRDSSRAIFVLGRAATTNRTLDESACDFLGFSIGGEVGCALVEGAIESGPIDAHLRELADRLPEIGLEGTLESECGGNVSIHRLRELPAEVRAWHIEKRGPLLATAMLGDRPALWEEIQHLHAVAMELDIRLPDTLNGLVSARLNLELARALEVQPLEVAAVEGLLSRAAAFGVDLGRIAASTSGGDIGGHTEGERRRVDIGPGGDCARSSTGAPCAATLAKHRTPKAYGGGVARAATAGGADLIMLRNSSPPR